jgi:hypothetical protein
MSGSKKEPIPCDDKHLSNDHIVQEAVEKVNLHEIRRRLEDKLDDI